MESFIVVDRDGVVIASRVPWETIQKLVLLMMIQRHKRKTNCFHTITDSPAQLASIRHEIRRKTGGSCIAEAQNTVSKKHFANDRGNGWYYELNNQISSTYAASVERLKYEYIPMAA